MAEIYALKIDETTGAVGHAPPPPSPKKRLRLPLRTPQDIQRELARLYRQAKAKEIDTAEASKLANVLAIMGRMCETVNQEERLAALERVARDEAV